MYLGLDLGTSGLKGMLIDAEQNVLAIADAHYSVSNPHDGWSEQNPRDWIAAVEDIFAKLNAAVPSKMSALKSISFSGHMHGAVLLDKNGDILRPCILWNDTRSAKQAADMDNQTAFREISGNIVFPGFTAPKLAWVQDNEPEIFLQLAMVLLPKDYLRLWLSGNNVMDMSDASGTSWLDVGRREWSSDLIPASKMRREQLPALCEGTDITGNIRSDIAQKWSLPKSVKIVGGGADNAVAACGVGVFREGEGFVSLGTSGVLLAARNGFHPAPQTAIHSFCHAIPDAWYQMGVILSATDSLNWLSKITGKSAAELAGSVNAAAPSSVRFSPYLSGERTPHNDADIRGAFTGLGIGTETSDLAQAVMEGVAFALRDNYEALKSTGANLQSLIALGGGAASQYWVQILSDLLDLRIEVPKEGAFGAALGAARLAMIGAEKANPIDVLNKPEIAKVILPRSKFQASYEDAYQKFTMTYPKLKAMQ